MNQVSARHRVEDSALASPTPSVGAIFDPIFKVELATTSRLEDEAHALRYQVYCKERPFEDAGCFPDGRECDAYDRRAVHAVVRHRPTGVCAATVRLVLADANDRTAPFPMEEPCRGALDSAAMATLEEPPKSRIAEISRFAVSREFRHRCSEEATVGGVDQPPAEAEDAYRAMPYLAVGLFAAVLRMSIRHGITHWMAVMEPTLLRLLKRYGIEFGHVGATVDYHGRRKPVVSEAATLLERIRLGRPDIWRYLTDNGRVLPRQPQNAAPRMRPITLLRRHRNNAACDSPTPVRLAVTSAAERANSAR